MSDFEPDIGPATGVVFVGLQYDELGSEVACFVTDDGGSFALDRATLELRIQAQSSRALESAEERRALRSMQSV